MTDIKSPAPADPEPPAPAHPRILDYALLLKPRVMSLVVFTAWTGQMMAPGSIDPVTALIAVLCIAIAAGASGITKTVVSRYRSGLDEIDGGF